MDKSIYTLGGAVWLNLINTIHMSNKRKVDELAEQVNAEQWLDANRLFPTKDTALGQGQFGLLHAELVLLRDICFDILFDFERHGEMSETTLTLFQERIESVSLGLKLHRTSGKDQLEYTGKTAIDHVRYEIVRSVLDTLNTYSADRIRKCEHEECILHFVDTSKSGKRRWCSMESCGNRHKAAEFYAKRKKGS